MVILGLDPGTATTGFGLLYKNGKGLDVLDWGLIETDKKNNKGHRLQSIYKETLALFKKHSPDVMAMESIFFAANAKTAIAVGQAQGVMLLAASKSNVKVVEYAPGSIKKIVSGNGRSDKKMMQTALRKILGSKVRSAKHKKTHFDNAADALAVALTHAMSI